MADQHQLSTELRARFALERNHFRATHSLGQNFILDERLITRLLDDCALSEEDNVLEIGPGAGVMTHGLAERARRVVAVEIDRALEPVLGEVLDDLDNVRVVYQDFMKTDAAALVGEAFDGEPYRVVANLPYYITADILMRLATCSCPPQSICIMVQKEAAERIMSAPGTKQWCALAANLKYYGQARVLEEVSPDAFDPPPHVLSCFLRIDRHPVPIVDPADPQIFLRLITAAFAMRRKTLTNNLKAAFALTPADAAETLARAGLDPKIRGEALSLEELCKVSDLLTARLARKADAEP